MATGGLFIRVKKTKCSLKPFVPSIQMYVRNGCYIKNINTTRSIVMDKLQLATLTYSIPDFER